MFVQMKNYFTFAVPKVRHTNLVGVTFKS